LGSLFSLEKQRGRHRKHTTDDEEDSGKETWEKAAEAEKEEADT
jgi:hypothetical protein